MSEQRPIDIKRQRKREAERAAKARRERDGSLQRLFLAVPLPDDVVNLVDNLIRRLQSEGWPVRWTAAGNAHITLHFLGEVAPENAQLLRLGLPEIVARHQRFRLRTADPGVFPNLKRPRVIWLGLWGPAHRLNSLHDDLAGLLTSLDFEVEAREFHPHITLGRVRNDPNTRVRDLPGRIRERFEQAARTGEVSHDHPLQVPVDEVVLVESHLDAGGPTYDIVERYPLGTPPRRER
jgi:2'-5' RNA ligase